MSRMERATKSPIQRAEQPEDAQAEPAPRKPRAALKKKAVAPAAVPLTEVIKARKAQNAVLSARMKVINREVGKLMAEYEQIAGILGVETSIRAVIGAPPAAPRADDDSFAISGHEYTCADCGSHAGPNAKHECSRCGAYPFEQAL